MDFEVHLYYKNGIIIGVNFPVLKKYVHAASVYTEARRCNYLRDYGFMHSIHGGFEMFMFAGDDNRPLDAIKADIATAIDMVHHPSYRDSADLDYIVVDIRKQLPDILGYIQIRDFDEV